MNSLIFRNLIKRFNIFNNQEYKSSESLSSGKNYPQSGNQLNRRSIFDDTGIDIQKLNRVIQRTRSGF